MAGYARERRGFQDSNVTSTPHPNPPLKGVGFLREGGDQDPPSLKPPLEVSETFGGAKVSDDQPAIKESQKPKHQLKKEQKNPKNDTDK